MRPYASRFLSREFGLGTHLLIYSRARRVTPKLTKPLCYELNLYAQLLRSSTHLLIYSRARRVFYREFGLAPLASNAAYGCSAALESVPI